MVLKRRNSSTNRIRGKMLEMLVGAGIMLVGIVVGGAIGTIPKKDEE